MVQQSFQGGVADVQLLGSHSSGDIPGGKTNLDLVEPAAKSSPVHNLGPSDALALSAGPVHSGFYPLPDQLQLELS